MHTHAILLQTIAATEPKTAVPLCVDLDGTLLRTDLVWESLARLLKQNPLFLFPILIWLMRGRAYLKAQAASRVRLEMDTLPYNQPVLDFLRAEKREGRRLVLATASDSRLAQQIADHLKLFDEIVASDGRTNIRGRNKSAMLAAKFGRGGFDYVGNSSVDLPVWEQARHALVVGGSRLAEQAREHATVSRTFDSGTSVIPAVLTMLRPHQWVKNLILFVPLLTSHNLHRPGLVLQTLIGFLSFSFCASGLYVLNDLLDLDSDRHHPRKRLRALAAGQAPLAAGFVSVPLLMATGGALAWALTPGFGLVLAAYALITVSYSLRLKEIALLDVFCLTGLYIIRLVAGHAATGIKYSFWLLLFAMFIFLSLALLKRFTELMVARQHNMPDLKGRGYAASDLELVATLGSANGYLAVLVLALYVNSQEVRELYQHPMLLLLICPLLLYWISRLWMIAHRGQMHDDPIIFALKDRASYAVGGLTLAVMWLATNH